tara:strand:+ start:200 stop:346 length:147 start_codon:yes stop_codon:yes gene_type:complete
MGYVNIVKSWVGQPEKKHRCRLVMYILPEKREETLSMKRRRYRTRIHE